MKKPVKPFTRPQIVLVAFAALGFAAWFFHDGLTVMRTGRPIYLAHTKHDHNTRSALECFLGSAGFTVFAVTLLGIAGGVIKGRQDAP